MNTSYQIADVIGFYVGLAWWLTGVWLVLRGRTERGRIAGWIMLVAYAEFLAAFPAIMALFSWVRILVLVVIAISLLPSDAYRSRKLSESPDINRKLP